MRKRLTGILVLAGWFAGLWAQEVQETPSPQETQEVQEAPRTPETQEVQETPIPRETQEVQELPRTQEIQEGQERLDPQEGQEPPLRVETREAVKLNEVLIPEETQETAKLKEVLRPQEARPVVEEEREMVPYNPDFDFREGIYPNFERVKHNDPIPTARIVTDVDMFDRDFYEKVTSQKEIVIYDNNGVKKVLETKDIWGYGRNGLLYINIGNAFHRVSFVGSISHFVASVTTYSPNYYDPYYYNPYYSNSYYYNRYNMPRSNYTNTELRQYLLDFETGDVLNYDTESVEVLLMKDPELADEYGTLNNRKKKQMKFVYIRKFNEKHPLYFPAN